RGRPRHAGDARPERRREPAEEEDLLVGGLGGDDDPDLPGVPQARRGRRQGVRPRRRHELLVTADERLREPPLALEVPVREPAGVAHPVLVHGEVLPRLEAEDAPLAMVDLDVAAVRARAAHRLRTFEVPDSRSEAEVAAGERADGTDV